MKIQMVTINPTNEVQSLQANYQAPVLIELEISQLVQSATNIMSESNSGYYS